MSALTPLSLPEEALAILASPWRGDPFAVRPPHIARLMTLRVQPLLAEAGAPMQNVLVPYDDVDVQGLRRPPPTRADWVALAAEHVAMVPTLLYARRDGRARLGRYQLTPDLMVDCLGLTTAEAQLGAEKAAEVLEREKRRAGIRADGTFELREAHVTLLRHLRLWDLPDRTAYAEALPMGVFPGFVFEPKRVYGESSDVEWDMARILGISEAGGLSEGTRARLSRLHEEMVVAFQVFVRAVDVRPGEYRPRTGGGL